MRKILSDFELEDRHYRVLLVAAQSLDRIFEARAIVKQEGLTTTDRYGTAKAHPAVKIEQDSRLTFIRALRELGLDPQATEALRLPRQY